MTDLEYMYENLKSIKNKTPLLIIGKGVPLFKKMYKGNIYNLTSLEDVREFISEFSEVELDFPIVIEDVSNLYRDSSLLKLIEESKFPLVMLASKDNLSDALMSRMKYILKIPETNESIELVSISQASAELKDKDWSQEEVNKYLADSCPQLLVLNDRIKKMKNKDKIIQIFAGLEHTSN